MGVNYLHTKFIKRAEYDQDNGENKDTLSSLAQALAAVVVGVDISIWFYHALLRKAAAEAFHTVPPIPNQPALKFIQGRIRCLMENGLKPLIVFDGAHNELKMATHDGRKRKSKEAKRELDALLKAGKVSDLPKIATLRKDSVFVDASLVALVKEWLVDAGIWFVQAPLEAEQQLVSLENDGIVDAVISEDGDTFALGGQTIISRVQWNYTKPKETMCCIYRAPDILQRESIGSGKWADYLSELSCFLGNDYIGNLYKAGYVTVRKWIIQT